MEEHELEHIVAAILTTAVFMRSSQAPNAEAAVKQYRQVIAELRRDGLTPQRTVPHE